LDADASERTGRAAGALQPSTVHASFVHAEEVVVVEEDDVVDGAEDEGGVDEGGDGEASEEAKGTFISRGMLA